MSSEPQHRVGFLIKSPELANALEPVFFELVRLAAYEVALGEGGELRWLEFNGNGGG